MIPSGSLWPRGTSRQTRAGLAMGLVLLAVPLLVALFGPVLGPWLSAQNAVRNPAFTTEIGVWGTDFVGRDVLGQVLVGGVSVVVVAVLATVVTYLVGVPLALVAATTARRAVDEVIMRPLDVVIAMPSLLVLLLLASVVPGSVVVISLVVALINLPDVVRICRASALSVAARPAVEAMRLQGEGWWRIAVGYVGRSILRVVTTDAGTRLTGALYLVASASFLGVGLAADDSNWAVMVDGNRGGIFVNPAATVIPALLIIALSVGTNLTSDQLLARRAARSPS
ncbi:ABC transporter permease subunit [Pseudonocardia sp. MH-G8]|uniref:ABC transporter permease subunit n=1 Tax=Pseudonocardia sp. MH-G8 TaxID=1854588 RepID=UPI001E521826|nr:ABC transporter permease subunit [Pseudonocardia sp. MH-G8]